jgi:hypothetical protein
MTTMAAMPRLLALESVPGRRLTGNRHHRRVTAPTAYAIRLSRLSLL